MRRGPRGTCPGAALTKTEQLRQAKTAALVKSIAEKEAAAAKQQLAATKVRKRIPMPEPKKVDFSKPGLTKTMVARMKQAEKFKQEYERKQEALKAERSRPRRTPAPIGGDARMGRERVAPRSKPTLPPGRKSLPACCSKDPPGRPKSGGQGLTRKTTELAKVMNADVIQAEPVGDGPVSHIVIPPGVVNEDHTTIVNISPSPGAAAADAGASQIANRSIQVISETLDEQDAQESAAVQNKLTELQQARRDFVMAVANVGGNAVNIEGDAAADPFARAGPMSTKAAYDFLRSGSPPPSPPPKRIVRIPDVQSAYLRPEFGLEHPDVQAARAHIAKVRADMEARETARRVEEEFGRIATEQVSDEIQLDVPFEEELFLEPDISWEEDEAGLLMPRPSRVKAHVEPVPKRQQGYQYEPFDPEDLERFFDVEQYPPCRTCGPPPGREQLHPDLWELEDPWYKLPPCDEPDLIQFD